MPLKSFCVFSVLLSWLFFSCPAKIRVIALFSGTPVASRSVTDTSSYTCLGHPASHCSCKEKHCNTTTTGNSSEARSTESHYSINEFEIATTLGLWNTSSAQCNGIWFCSLAASLCVQPLCIHVSWVTAGVFCWSGLYCSVIHPVASLTTTQRFLMLWVCLMIEFFGELSLI